MSLISQISTRNEFIESGITSNSGRKHKQENVGQLSHTLGHYLANLFNKLKDSLSKI